MRTIARMLLLSTLGLAWWLPAWGVEVFTIGEEDRSWDEFGATPGGVIAFVDRLGEIRDGDGRPIFGEQADALRDWIMPLRLRPDFNISLGILERGGGIDVPNLDRTQKSAAELEGMLDGNHQVAFDRKFVAGRIVRNNGIRIRMDLGARFGVNRIVFYPRDTPQFPFGNDFLRAYELYLNDGLPQNLFASGQPIFTSPVVRDEDNSESVVNVLIEPQFVRYIELKSISTVGFEIDEIEVYGTGFVPVATYISDVLDLGEWVVWGTIDWAERIAGDPRNSGVEVRVRSGSDDTPDVYYRIVALGGGRTELVPTTSRGDTLTRESYEKQLRDNERGPIKVDVENWSQWQLVRSGDELGVPAPRRYFQFRVDFANQTLDAGRTMDWLQFEFDRPPVDRIVAELSPSRVEIGVPTTFTYVARIINETERPGIERFEIETPARVAAIHSVEILDREGKRLGGAEFRKNSGTAPVESGDFSIREVEDDHFTLGLPRIAADGTLLKIVFDAAAFRYGTRFLGRAFAAETAELPLLTEGGDATPELETDDLLVRVSVGEEIAGPVDVEPAVFTPNGDGVNDVAEIAYSVFHLLTLSPVEVTVFDLAGRRVRQLRVAEEENGRYVQLWDGLDDEGERVVPGLYLVEVAITADRKSEKRTALIGVTY